MACTYPHHPRHQSPIRVCVNHQQPPHTPCSEDKYQHCCLYGMLACLPPLACCELPWRPPSLYTHAICTQYGGKQRTVFHARTSSNRPLRSKCKVHAVQLKTSAIGPRHCCHQCLIKIARCLSSLLQLQVQKAMPAQTARSQTHSAAVPAQTRKQQRILSCECICGSSQFTTCNKASVGYTASLRATAASPHSLSPSQKTCSRKNDCSPKNATCWACAYR